MQTEHTTIRPLPIGRTAIEIARECYNKWGGLVTFDEDLTDYLQTGMVWARPDVFVMAKVIDLGNEPGAVTRPAWFIRVAVGNLGALLRLIPLYLPEICFCRRGDPHLKVYSLKRLFELARRNNNGRIT